MDAASFRTTSRVSIPPTAKAADVPSQLPASVPTATHRFGPWGESPGSVPVVGLPVPAHRTGGRVGTGWGSGSGAFVLVVVLPGRGAAPETEVGGASVVVGATVVVVVVAAVVAVVTVVGGAAEAAGRRPDPPGATAMTSAIDAATAAVADAARRRRPRGPSARLRRSSDRGPPTGPLTGSWPPGP
jgi:hypothetical protein